MFTSVLCSAIVSSHMFLLSPRNVIGVIQEIDFKFYLTLINLNSFLALLIGLLGTFLIQMLYYFNFQIILVSHWELGFIYGIRYESNFLFLYEYPNGTVPFVKQSFFLHCFVVLITCQVSEYAQSVSGFFFLFHSLVYLYANTVLTSLLQIYVKY